MTACCAAQEKSMVLTHGRSYRNEGGSVFWLVIDLLLQQAYVYLTNGGLDRIASNPFEAAAIERKSTSDGISPDQQSAPGDTVDLRKDVLRFLVIDFVPGTFTHG
jgi:hypothetical protein